MRALLAAPGAAPAMAPALSGAARVALLFVAAIAAAALSSGVAPLRVAVLLAIAPLAEEAVLRAGLHEALLRRAVAPWRANLMSALLFAVAHALLRADPAALAVVLPALLIGALYGRTRRLRDAVLLHAALNALWLAAGLADLLPRFLR
jgi:membrane protease YdiL (CAAX protease family)